MGLGGRWEDAAVLVSPTGMTGPSVSSWSQAAITTLVATLQPNGSCKPIKHTIKSSPARKCQYLHLDGGRHRWIRLTRHGAWDLVLHCTALQKDAPSPPPPPPQKRAQGLDGDMGLQNDPL